MTFSTQQDLATDLWHIYCTSHGRTAIAGPRILRGPPHPVVAFAHETEAGAEADAAKLRAYFEAMPKAKKGKSKAKGAFEE